MSKAVLSLYDHSGVMVKPWLERGYRAYIVDLLHPPGVTREGNLIKIGGDLRVLKWRLAKLKHVQLVTAFPPCTDLAVSGARWFERKRRRNPFFQEEAMELVYIARDLAKALNAPYMIENPVSVISTYWRKPDHTFHPWHYAGWAKEDHYTKLTCLWAGNGFQMPGRLSLNQSVAGPPDAERIWLMPRSKDRPAKKSVTPSGFAKAVFWSNVDVRRLL